LRSFHPIKQQQQLQAVVACSFRKHAQEGQPSKFPTQRSSAQRSTALHRTAQHPSVAPPPSHASIKRRAPRAALTLFLSLSHLLLVLPLRTAISHVRLSSGYVYCSHPLIAFFRESRRDARVLLLSTWDRDMDYPVPPPVSRHSIAYRNDISNSNLPRCGAITSVCHARHGR
jgi:hypothetical protein